MLTRVVNESENLAHLIFNLVMPEYSEFEINEISPNSANSVYSVSVGGENKFFLKIYNKESQRAVVSREGLVYKSLKGKSAHITDVIEHSFYKNHEFIVLPFLKGRELLKVLESEEISPKAMNLLALQLGAFVEDCTSQSTTGYGSMDSDGVGIFKTWREFLKNDIDSMNDSIEAVGSLYGETYRDFFSSVINSLKLFVEKYSIYFDSVSSRLTPVDLNLCNFLVTSEDKLFAVDLESFMAGDPLMAYGELIGHIYGSAFGESFSYLWDGWSELQKDVVHFYALSCNLCVLMFCMREEVRASTGLKFESLRPWGNPNTFIDLISSHQDVIIRRLKMDDQNAASDEISEDSVHKLPVQNRFFSSDRPVVSASNHESIEKILKNDL